MNWQDVRQSLPDLGTDRPVLIAGATATGKSALALMIAEELGGVIVNADASQVYDCWRVVTARPSPEEEARAPHALYGHVGCDAEYSTGHWLRDVAGVLKTRERPIIVGGTGLYFTALTEGLADIPATPPALREKANAIALDDLLSGIAPETAAALDQANRARVQRAWEVEQATGTPLHVWQAQAAPPLLPLDQCTPILLNAEKDWLESRIRQRFDKMLDGGALDEVAAMRSRFDPARPAFRAIGVPEIMAYLNGQATLEETRERTAISTRQFAKRQRTWFRKRMAGWHQLPWPPTAA